MKLLLKHWRANPSCVTVLCSAVIVSFIFVSGAAVADDAALHVLLTNDDGYDAPGITTMHKALLGAGYKVTVVAPLNQQSGSSMHVTMGSIAVEQLSSDVWTVAGTPADAVAYALNKTLGGDLPDIVVSGSNFGQNLGSNTNLSGTVGAAIMATQHGVPAVAVSVGIDLAERDAKPVRFPSTVDAFPAAAEFTVRVLRQLDEDRAPGGALLPPNKVLNLNYPALPAAKIKGVHMTQVAAVGGFVGRFVETDEPGIIEIKLEKTDPNDDSVEYPDTMLFADGYITVSVLDGRLGAGQSDTDDMAGRLKQILGLSSPASTQLVP